MRTANTIYDILKNIDEGIVNNNKNNHYILFMKMIHNFVFESEEIHFDYQFDFFNKTNYLLTRLHETCNKELKKEYYEMRELILKNLERIQNDKDESEEKRYLTRSHKF